MCAVCAGGQRNSSHPGAGDSRLRGSGDARRLSGHVDTGAEVARDLVKSLRGDVTTDWVSRDDVRAKTR